MPGKTTDSRGLYQNVRRERIGSAGPKKKKRNPNFMQDSSKQGTSDSETESNLSTSRTYHSTCTQTTETNTIDSQNRVIRRKINSNGRSRMDQYRISGTSDRKLREYIVTKSGYHDPRSVTENTEGRRVIVRRIRQRPSSSDGRVVRIVPKSYDQRIIRTRPSSYHDERIERADDRIVRYRSSSYDGIHKIRDPNYYDIEQPRRYVVVRRANSYDRVQNGRQQFTTLRKANSYTGLSDKVVVVRRRPQTATQPVRRVVQKSVMTENAHNTEGTNRVIYRRVVPSESSETDSSSETDYTDRPTRPRSYHEATEEKVVRAPRPSSYHEGMSKDYEAVPQEPQAVKHVPDRRALREYQLQNEPERSRAVKQYEGDKWVDEHEVDDTVEKREVGVQMTTKFVLPPPPPKPKTRNVGTQTKEKKPPPKPPTPPPPPETPPPPPPPPPLPPKIKEKSRYVRVGGGWMKIDHYRNHHVPLKIFEHPRAKNDKYLSIKYRYTKDQKNTPKAWSKYRSCVAFDS